MEDATPTRIKVDTDCGYSYRFNALENAAEVAISWPSGSNGVQRVSFAVR